MKKIYALLALCYISLAAGAQTTTYSTPGTYTFNVPAGVTQILVDMQGAKGGDNNNWPAGSFPSQGGFGGRVVCTLAVTGGQPLQINVGGAGVSGTTVPGTGGFNGGANGAAGSAPTYNGGGGGGASDVRFSPYGLADRKVVAGGGGGAGLNNPGNQQKGGNGGGLTAQNGFSGGSPTCGTGGSQVCCAAGGSGGAAGSLGNGGAAAAGNASGGGGGGYYGGGGGGTSWCAGGGGSSFTAAGIASDVVHTQGYNTAGNGIVSITTLSPNVIPSPSSLSFGAVLVGGSAQQTIVVNGTLLTSSPLTINTTSARFEFSLDGTNWFNTAQPYSFTPPSITNVPIFVRFLPIATGLVSGNITISGGGLFATLNIPVSGTGAATCSGVPAAGTAGASPSSGLTSASYTLTHSGTSTGAGITYQWQSSPDNASWTNVAGATNTPYTFSGLPGNTYYRMVTTCPSFTPSASTSTFISMIMPSASCTANYSSASSACVSFAIIITNFVLGTINDAAACNSTGYQDRTSLSTTVTAGTTVTANVTVGPSNPQYAQVFLDYNNDGVFQMTETIGGTATGWVGAGTVPMTIPSTVAAGAYRMRIVTSFTGSGIVYPSLSPCATGLTYGEIRDYTLKVAAAAPAVSVSPASINFGNVTNGSTTVAQVFSATATNMPGNSVTVNTSTPSFEFSFNGTTWFNTAQTYYFATPGFTNMPIYVRFKPTVIGTITGNITFSGGGLAVAKNVPMTGNGVLACDGTPTAGTAIISPLGGTAATSFTLFTTDYSSDGSLAFQWQSSPNGSTGWTNIAGATNATRTFSGLAATTYYRCNVTCVPSGITSTTNVVSAMFIPSVCIPDYSSNCSLPMYISIGTFAGSGGTSFSDPATSCTAEYIDNTATHAVTLYKGLSYTPTINATTSYYTGPYSAQVWIDFDGNGTFISSESVGGLATFPSATIPMTITIPSGVPTGTYRMRIVGNYTGCCGGLTYPNIPPCPTTSITYGQSRDYTVTILPYPTCDAPVTQPTNLTFTAGLFNINGSFSPSMPAAENYLVVMTTSAAPPAAPANGTTYVAGTNALGGKIISAGPSTSFSVSGLTDNTQYWFWVYSYMTTCTGTAPSYRVVSPLSGSWTTEACALSGVKTIGTGGDYPTLASAVTAINTLGLGPNLSLEILPSYTLETLPITIGSLLCASETRRLTIRPHSSNAVKKVLTASVTTPIISLNGARYVTLDGRIGSTGSTKMLELVNNDVSSSLASTVQFINDASYNAVRHMSLRGSNISTAGGVVQFLTTTGSTGNDYNVVDNTDIFDAATTPYNCIYAQGTSAKENNNDTISNCNIFNYFTPSTQSIGIYVTSGNTDWNISGNRLYQTTTRNYNVSSTMYGIYITNTSSGNNFTVNNNIIGYSSNNGTGTYAMTSSTSTVFKGISLAVANVTPSSVQGNTITNLSFQHTSTVASITGIDITSGSANIGTVTGNTIGGATGNGAITRIISSNGSIAMRGIATSSPSPGVVNIANNNIGSINLQGSSTAVGVGFYGIEATGTASTTITGNTIGSATTPNSISTSVTTTGSPVIYGIMASISSTTPVPPVISDNIISNMTANCTGSSNRMSGILFNSTSSGQILRNRISNLTSASAYTAVSTDVALSGIMYTGSTGSANISQNTINALACTNTISSIVSVMGILYTNSVDGSITRNRIYDLRTAATQNSTTSPPHADAIFLYQPITSVTVANNMITLGMGQTSNTAFTGIMSAINSSYILRVYHNSIHIGGTAATGVINTTCFQRGNYGSGTVSAPTVDIRNNIFNNTRTGGTGSHYAITNNLNYTGSTSGWPAGASNYNILNSANPATLTYWSGAKPIATWRTTSGNSDLNSFTGTPVTFADVNTADLHINMGTTPNDIESHGNLVASVATDYDNETRPGPTGSINGGGAAPDIGADEIDGVANDNIPPAITHALPTCGAASDYIFTATLADPSGVATGGNAPRVYYRKNGGAYSFAQSAPGVLVSGTPVNGVWSFTVSAAAMGGLTGGNTVSFFVIAQDNSAFVGSNTNTGMLASNVNSISSYPTNATTYTVGLGGTYTVGSGGNYSTLTAAANDYNARCLAGPVVFSLISPTYPSESYPILLNNTTWANSTNTLTIRPAAGVAANITGNPGSNAMIRLLQAKYVTIDGIKSGGASLTLNNTYTGSNTACIQIASNGNGALASRNITLKNMTLNGGSNTVNPTFGILAINTSIPTNTSGADNDTITIEGNTITRNYYGIYALGTSSLSTGGLDNWVVRNNIIGPAAFSTTDNIGQYGIFMGSALNPLISGNTIQNLGQTTSSFQVAGIYMTSSVNGYSIDSNTIRAITSNYSVTGSSSNAGVYLGSSVINGSVTRNTIYNIANVYPSSGGGARGILVNTSNSFTNVLVANNMISDIKCYSQTSMSYAPVGISLETTVGYAKIYHNTVHLNSTFAGYNSSTYSACFYSNSGGTNIDLRNNLFINAFNNTGSTTDKGWAFYTTQPSTTFSELDYNNYFSVAPNITAYTSADRVTLNDFRTAYGRNVNSISNNGTFVSSTDLHLPSIMANTVFKAGTPLALVTKDIDGTNRNPATPVMGAHEVQFCTFITAGTVAAATNVFCGTGSTAITATGATVGENMIWRSSPDSVNWTTIPGANTATYVTPTLTSTMYYRFVNKCNTTVLADSGAVKVTINPIPAAITGTLAVCGTATTTLNSTTSGGTWTSSNSSVAFINNLTGAVTPGAIGTSTITYRMPATGCQTTAVASVNAAPTVSSVSATTVVCPGGTIALSGTGASGTGTLTSYNWTGPNGYSSTTTGSSTSLTAVTASAGEYSLSVSYAGNGCTSARVMTGADVTVNPLPAIGTITSSSSLLCVGATLTLNAFTPSGTGSLTSYDWSGPGGYSASTPGNSASLTVGAGSSGAYSVSVTYPGVGCTSAKIATSPAVTVNARPALASVTPSATIVCYGTPLNFTANTPTGTGTLTSYNWSGPNSFTDVTTTGTTGFTTTSTAESGSYSVTVTYPGTGCTSIPVSTAAIAVNAIPTLTGITPSATTLCIGTPLTLTATGSTGTGVPTAYTWTGPNSFSTSTTAASTVFTTTTTANSGAYSVSVTYPGTGCTSTKVVTAPAVTVNAQPTLASIAASTNNLCIGSPITFAANSPAGTGAVTGYNWSGPNGYSAATATGTASFTATTTAQSGVYSVTVSYPGTGCTSAPVVTSPAVTVNAIPTLTGVTASSSNLCVGTPLTLTANGSSGAGTVTAYTWSGPNSFSATTTGNSTVFTPATTSASGAYSVRVTYSGLGCNSNAAATSPAVTVNALPTVASITPSTTTLCIGAAVTFTAGAVTGTGALTSYNWTGPNSFSASTTVNNRAVTATTTAQTGAYSVTVTYPGTGCTSTAAVTSPAVTVNAVPSVAGITPSTNKLCVGTALTLNAGVTLGTGALVSYNWTGPNSYNTTTSANSAVFTATTTAASGNYSLTVTYPGVGCTSPSVQTSPAVTVNALPTISSISATPGTLCENDVLTLSASGATGVAPLVSYNWTGPNSYSTTTTGAGQTYTVPATTASGAYSVSVSYQGTGCTSARVQSTAVTVNAVPLAQTVTGGGSYCAGGSGVPIGLSGSQTGVNYQLYNGAAMVGSPVAGTGAAISFGMHTTVGTTYTVLATNTTTGCKSRYAPGTFVSTSSSPNAYTVTGGGSYCENTGGLHIYLSSSDPSVSYQLYRDGVVTGPLVVGTGSGLDFGAQLVSGTYSVVANPGATCTRTMTGGPTITMLPAPSAYDLTGSGTICAGDAGLHLTLSWSVVGINYQLYRGSSLVGSPVAGAVSALDMGTMNVAGNYTVRATNAITGCTAGMNGVVTVNVNPAPNPYAVTGGGTTCSGTGAVSVGLASSALNFNYQLYNGATAVGPVVAGTNSAITFGAQNSTGVYTVVGINTLTGCTGPMTGSATVSINPAPAAYAVTGGGSYCTGGAGYAVGLANTNTGFTYRLYNGATPVSSVMAGTGSAISFGTYTAAGTYTVLGTNTSTGCTGAMSGDATIVVNTLPTAYNVTGGGQYCSGSGGMPVGLSFSTTGVNYQLYNGSTATGLPVAGTGAAISFGSQTTTGTYSVLATNASSTCVAGMTGTVAVTENALPTQYSMTGGGQYCAGGAGVAMGLGLSQTGVNYQLYNGVPTAGSPIAGTGASISFGMQATGGTYTVLATNTTTGCTRAMTGSASVVVNPLPTQFVVTGGGNYCAGGSGVSVSVNGSEPGANYQLYNGSTATGSPVAGNGLAISLGTYTAMGSYSAVATYTLTGCSMNMYGSVPVVINPLPTAYTVTGGGGYCSGGTGVAIGLSSSTTGVSYQLYNGATPMGSPQAGSGLSLNFGNQTTAGTYSVFATNSVTTCTGGMANTVVVSINPLPTQYNVINGGTYCENGAGVNVSLSNSQTGINYQLYNGSTAMGSPVAGTGSGPLSFGNQTLAGTYTVLGTNATTSCSREMTSSATVIMNPAPAAHNVSGGGAYCSGGNGVSIGLESSTIGVNYQLYRGAATVSGQVAGTGSAISFGMYTVAGSYSVLATNTVTSCTRPMTGNAVVSINPLPAAYNMNGGGGYCDGGSGVTVGLVNSQTGVSYRLYRGATAMGAAVAGTGSAISFGQQTVAGTYSVLATNSTTGCTRAMTTTVNVIINALPPVYTMTGGGTYCAGGAGAHVGLSSSDAGINYQLYLGASPVGTPMAGSGAGLDYGEVYVAGSYSAVATNAITGCVSPMSGSVTVSVATPPTAYAVSGGGSYCSGGAGVTVNMSGSQAGVNYTLYNGSTATGTTLAGTGAALSFGAQTAAGTYTVRGTDATSGCSTNMTGSAAVAVSALPTVYNVTGGGQYCPGAAGVNIGLSGSAIGITYQLYNGATAVGSPITGTGSPVVMGVYTTVGTYTAVATNVLTGCTSNMTASASVSQHTLPMAYTMTGGGSYCNGGTGVAVGLNGSETGVSYQLYNGSSIAGTFAGTGSALNFGLQTSNGTYTVFATNTTTGCTRGMSGASTVSVNSLPTVYLTTGGGNYCSGGTGYTVVLNGSQTGINYQMYLDGVATGTAMPGTGSFLDFGIQMTAGFYTVKATNSTTGCMRAMAGSPEIVVHSLPVIQTVTGGGAYCAGGTGVEIGLNSSVTGTSYRLYSGSTPVGAIIPGNGGALTFGAQTAAGTYTVLATNTGTGCTQGMTGTATVIINALPATYDVTGGGGYCAGGNGVAIGLSGSDAGVNYQLYRNGVATGTALSGADAALDFGLNTAVGTYTIKGTSSSTGCSNTMTGMAVVSVNPTPATYTVTGGGSYCSGSAGTEIMLSGSEAGVNYVLYNGSAAGTTVAGTGLSVSFGMQSAGSYTVRAVNAGSLCEEAMNGSALITVNPLPTAYVVSGGGAVCAGTAGAAISLSGSDANISYSLYNGTTATGTTVMGSGSGISFGLQNTAGTYSVHATDMLTGCHGGMTGTATVSVNPAPAQFNVTGGGSYCAGGTGVTLNLTGSQAGVQYNLYRNGVATGTTLSGTGSAISYAPQFAAGSYTVKAVNSSTFCTSNMAGSATVSINAAPASFTVSGGGQYCAGGTGVTISLGGSAMGVAYKLYVGSTQVGSAIAGTGAAFSFGQQTAAGVYTVQAVNLATSCTSGMTGSATVAVNALPVAQAVTGGGAYCAGGAGVHIGVAASETGVSYRLFKGSTQVGAAIAGTDGALDFGFVTNAGTYMVTAQNNTTNCTNTMANTATVQVNVLPASQTVAGGGNYCSGGTGSEISMGNTQTGVSYQLYNGSEATGAALAGTGGPISFGAQMAAGAYSVLATNTTTACSRGMNGVANVGINALPEVFIVSGGGSYCAGGTGAGISMSGSQAGVTYRVYRGSVQAGVFTGTGSAMDLGMQTAAGSYTVKAENATGCIATMSGSATITINPRPAAFAVSAGGAYCAGGAGMAVTLAGSEASANYRLYNGAVAVGGTIEGTGEALSFGTMPAGSYSVLATNAVTGCTAAMTGSSAITINSLPNTYTVTGGGGYCAGNTGMPVGLANSQPGMSYQLYNGTEATGAAKAGTGSPITFGSQLAGDYTVLATSMTTGCTRTMTGTANVFTHDAPMAFEISSGGAYCAGGAGVAITLAGSQPGMSYRLYRGTATVGSAMTGTGMMLNFGQQAVAGNYTIKATNTTTGCSAVMTGAAAISINALPVAQAMTGGGSFCAGGIGVVVSLGASAEGISYQLYKGTVAVGDAVTGTGGELNMGTYTGAGAYTAIGTDIATGCSAPMSGAATVSVNALPAVYELSGSSTGYCAGGTGIQLSLAQSQTGVSYRLYNGAATSGNAVTGTGSSISFGNRTAEGTFSVLATNMSTGCTSAMAGAPSITIYALPALFPVNGGGSYCTGADGVAVGLTGTQAGVTYQLYKGGVVTGSAIAGTGEGISFGNQEAGSYTVRAMNATTGCRSNMTGSATVVTNPLPNTYAMNGGGAYCAGGTGVAIGLANSQPNMSYQLYNGTEASGPAIAGTGNAISFGARTDAGAYTVKAINTLTGCAVNMDGAATVEINTLPAAMTVTGGGAMCSGGTGVTTGLNNSAAGISYRLYKGATAVGSEVAGTGMAISFAPVTGAGIYTVQATNSANGCTSAMSGSAEVIVNALPASFSVTGGGSYCAGSDGVTVGLGGSVAGVTYSLYKGAAVVATATGTGDVISFGMQAAAGTYTVQATDATTGCMRNMAGNASVSITPAVMPVVTLASSAGDAVCAGTPVIYTTTQTNGGTSPAYQWKVNGANVGTGSGTYSYIPANGDVVSVTLSSNAACAMPATATATKTMTVNEKQMPVVTVAASIPGDTLCAGTAVTFTASAVFGGDAPVFEWIKNGSVAHSGNEFTFMPVNGDMVSVRMTSNHGCVVSALVNSEAQMLSVIAAAAPSVAIMANPGTRISKGQSLTLTAVAANTYQPTYQWYVNGAAVQNATSTAYTSTSFEDMDTVTCKVTNNTPCGNFVSFNTVQINVDAVGVHDVAAAAFDVRVMPNPSKGSFVISGTIDGLSGRKVTVELANMLGQVVYKGEADVRNGKIDARVDLGSGLANGMYLLNLHSDTDSKIFHVTLQQ